MKFQILRITLSKVKNRMEYIINNIEDINKFVDKEVKPFLFGLCEVDFIGKHKIPTINQALKIANEITNSGKVKKFAEGMGFEMETSIAALIVNYVKDYEYKLINKMKCKTGKFVNLLKQFADTNSFSIVSMADAFDSNTKIAKNTYYANLSFDGNELVMCIKDIPHKTTTYTLSCINDVCCSSDYNDINMFESKAENIFRRFLHWYELALQECEDE